MEEPTQYPAAPGQQYSVSPNPSKHQVAPKKKLLTFFICIFLLIPLLYIALRGVSNSGNQLPPQPQGRQNWLTENDTTLINYQITKNIYLQIPTRGSISDPIYQYPQSFVSSEERYLLQNGWRKLNTQHTSISDLFIFEKLGNFCTVEVLIMPERSDAQLYHKAISYTTAYFMPQAIVLTKTNGDVLIAFSKLNIILVLSLYYLFFLVMLLLVTRRKYILVPMGFLENLLIAVIRKWKILVPIFAVCLVAFYSLHQASSKINTTKWQSFNDGYISFTFPQDQHYVSEAPSLGVWEWSPDKVQPGDKGYSIQLNRQDKPYPQPVESSNISGQSRINDRHTEKINGISISIYSYNQNIQDCIGCHNEFATFRVGPYYYNLTLNLTDASLVPEMHAIIQSIRPVSRPKVSPTPVQQKIRWKDYISVRLPDGMYEDPRGVNSNCTYFGDVPKPMDVGITISTTGRTVIRLCYFLPDQMVKPDFADNDTFQLNGYTGGRVTGTNSYFGSHTDQVRLRDPHGGEADITLEIGDDKIFNQILSTFKFTDKNQTTVPSVITPSCIPRPTCLDATPRCLIAEPANGWCK